MTLRASALRELTAWPASSVDQVALRTSYLDYLRTHEDALWRTSRPAHLTASALVLDPADGQVLLTLHPKVGRWLQLVGSPVRLDRHKVRCAADGSSAYHLDVQYVALASHRQRTARSAESLDLRWWPVDALPPGTDDSVRSLVGRAVALVG